MLPSEQIKDIFEHDRFDWNVNSILDSGNINKKDNICFCKDFFDKHIPENVDCLKDPGPDSDVYDISNCTVTNCHDGLQNIENVS